MSEYAYGKAVEAAKALLGEASTADLGEIELKPPPKGLGDFGLACFRPAQATGQKPVEYAKDLADSIKPRPGGPIANVEAAGPYVNFVLDHSWFSRRVSEEIAEMGEDYGTWELGKGQTIVTDFSSPNIAKPFSVGHLRSTIIGDAINKLFRALGYTVIGDNHLGDWGTQFGKLAVAIEHWGDRATIERNPIPELNALYVRFHEEIAAEETTADKTAAEETPETPLEEDAEEVKEAHPLIVEARAWFKKLEAGDPGARELWQWLVDLSMKDFQQIYDTLGVTFQEELGESFYNDKMPAVIETLKKSGHLQQDASGAWIVPLDKEGIETPLLVVKSDGASVYATRDLAGGLYRQDQWHPAKILYVVGGEQRFYFQQVFAVMKMLGVTAELVHIWFGMVQMRDPETGKTAKMSTRRGQVILLQELIDEATRRAADVIQEREMDPTTKERIAKQVAIAALKFADLGQSRQRDIVFDWDQILSLTGDSGPYLQYTAVRAGSILNKAGSLKDTADGGKLGEEEWPLVKLLSQFPYALREAAESYEPHRVAKYLLDLAGAFNMFYAGTNIIRTEDDELRTARLHLVQNVRQVLISGLQLLGIEVPEKM